MKLFIFDFDGTITINDTTDLILNIPNQNEIWQIEKEWEEGKITSYECMKAQARFLKGIRIEEVQQHLNQYSVMNPFFPKLTHFLKSANFYTTILSEGYDIALQFHDLHKHIRDIHSSKLLTAKGILTGELEVSNERTWNYNTKCIGCCICKVDFLLQLTKKVQITQSFAVGDGKSDECLFRYVDVSFSLNPKYNSTYQVQDLSDVLKILKKNN